MNNFSILFRQHNVRALSKLSTPPDSSPFLSLSATLVLCVLAGAKVATSTVSASGILWLFVNSLPRRSKPFSTFAFYLSPLLV